MIEKHVLEITAERDYQDSKWGRAFDDKNTVNDWAAYITQYLSRATVMGVKPDKQREALVKTAALCVAALEAFDRNGAFTNRHYD